MKRFNYLIVYKYYKLGKEYYGNITITSNVRLRYNDSESIRQEIWNQCEDKPESSNNIILLNIIRM